MQWNGQPVDDGDQRVEDGRDVAGHVVAQLDRDLAFATIPTIRGIREQ